METKAAFYPTIFAILMAATSVIGFPVPYTSYGIPWLTAVHTQTMPDGQTYGVDNILFYLWGHQYTVVGNIVQTTFVVYDWRDFPFYSLLATVVALISGILALLANRSVSLI